MHPIFAYLKRLAAKFNTGFQPDLFALWGIHTGEIFQTIVFHPAAWTNLHLAVAIALVATALKWLKA